MTKSEHDGNGKKNLYFFAAVAKNGRTAVEDSENAVRREVKEWGVTKNNIAVFECYFNGTNTKKELTHRRRFPLRPRHYRALENACLDFLENEMGV